MTKDPRSLMPIGARRADSVTSCQEVILDTLASEWTSTKGDNPYIAFCDKFGFDENTTTIRELLSHAELMAGLMGNPTAQANLKNRLEGKLAEKVEVVNPLASLTDEQLDKLEGVEVKRIEGGKDSG